METVKTMCELCVGFETRFRELADCFTEVEVERRFQLDEIETVET